ncbi:hypothetical protein QR680_011293 [Steinernema hermaphroditum]|uniref:Uncharacterized protein n=1 Tax=Steinernema hermaphroditum TaxID=289476 RepID=A0AA39ITK1_9BILA|nr:hypothetical protein QR680_011293 [Steinernema hermaphroditum]
MASGKLFKGLRRHQHFKLVALMLPIGGRPPTGVSRRGSPVLAPLNDKWKWPSGECNNNNSVTCRDDDLLTQSATFTIYCAIYSRSAHPISVGFLLFKISSVMWPISALHFNKLEEEPHHKEVLLSTLPK